ncbi:MAG: DUF4331 family protein [Candidatus Limnocylindria bacterium]
MVSRVTALPGIRPGIAILIAALILTLGIAPLLTVGADHLDAPSLGSASNVNDQLSVSKVRGPLDINDVYAFDGSMGATTVLAVTVNPAVNVLGPRSFQAGAEYRLNVDRTGDAVADLRYTVTFGDADAAGIQHYTVMLGDRAVASGFTDDAKGKSQSRDGVRAFAGVRSDPFFFDLLGFLGTVRGQGTDCLGCNPTDFFVALDTLAIVLEVPNAQLGGNGTGIGVWATTVADGMVADQMGRPAINTVFNVSAAHKEAFNATPPAQQRTAMGGVFRQNVIDTLIALSSLGTAYTPDQAAGIADVLLPDVLTYQVGSDAAFLNGRDLDDDVIDIELGLVTNGAVAGDGVGAHADYLATFPYLGAPH